MLRVSNVAILSKEYILNSVRKRQLEILGPPYCIQDSLLVRFVILVDILTLQEANHVWTALLVSDATALPRLLKCVL